MDPIRLSRAERASLRKLVKLHGTCECRQLHKTHAERFLRDGLITHTPQRYHLTTRGQVEILRQRFRGFPGFRKSTAGESETAMDEWLFARAESQSP